MIYTILKLRVSLLRDTEPEIREDAVFELFVFTSFLASKIGQFLEKNCFGIHQNHLLSSKLYKI